MDNSAPNRPHFGVEEVPSSPVASKAPVVSEMPPAIDLSMAPPNPESPRQTVIETIPPIPHFEVDSPPEPVQMQQQAQVPPQSPPTIALGSAVSSSNLPPDGHNVMGKSHHLRKFLFLIPAILLVATIYFVAKFTGNDFTVRELPPIVTPAPSEAPSEAVPTPTPISRKSYKNEEMLIEMMVPDSYEVMSEDAESVSFGKDGTEVLIVRTNEFTNYDDEDEPLNVLVGGREAVELNLEDEGSVPMRIVQTIDDPQYEFVMFLEDSVMSVEFQEILDSVVFLVDTSDWETFDNTTFNYKISYPPDWTEATAANKEVLSAKTEISKDPENKEQNNLVIQTSSNLENAALTASEIISSSRTLSGWSSPPRIDYKKIGGGDAQVIQGELSGKWRAYVVIWYKNSVVQMIWDDAPARPGQQIFDNMLSSFEFTI